MFPCVCAGPQILESSTEGQREAALAALQDKGISILTGASVAQLVRAGAHPPLEADADLSKRVVYVTDRLGQQEVGRREGVVVARIGL